ncbi:hypothetical protein ACA910_003038 [Epithemia clementina (nom. ined.)]
MSEEQQQQMTTNTNAKTATVLSTTTAVLPDNVRDQIVRLLTVEQHKTDLATLRRLLDQYPQAASPSIRYAFYHQQGSSNTTNSSTNKTEASAQETLLSLALLHLAPLEMIQLIHQACPQSLTVGNAHGMSAFHQAATVATPLDVWKFLVTQLTTTTTQQSQSPQHSIAHVSQLVAPANWTVLHIACRCGRLPMDPLIIWFDKPRRVWLNAPKTRVPRPCIWPCSVFCIERRSSNDSCYSV